MFNDEKLMNPSYIGISKTIEIPKMSYSFVESSRNEESESGVVITGELFKQLFHDHYSFLCHLALEVVGDKEAAKDIVQSFFLYCWEKRSSVHIQESFLRYACRGIRNAALNYKKRGARVNYNSDFIAEAADTLKHTHEADSRYIEKDRDRFLWETIGLLPPKRKQIFLLSQKEGLTYRQIAEQLDISVNTVKTQIKMAYVFLRKECAWLASILLWILFLK